MSLLILEHLKSGFYKIFGIRKREFTWNKEFKKLQTWETGSQDKEFWDEEQFINFLKQIRC